jgi:glycosyltransferase involved in cell wall biosynthesis
VEATRILRSKGRKVRLTVVGPIPPALATEWAAVEGVLLLGRVSRTELYRQYSESDVYAMPSFSDTFGMVFVEAMAFGLPVVALDRPYTREIIRDGETGLLAKLGDSSVAWCDAWGGFTMDSDAFIRCVLDADVDMTVVAELVEQLDRLVDDPALRRRLGDRGREEVLDGRFSVTRRNATLGEVYSTAARGWDQ